MADVKVVIDHSDGEIKSIVSNTEIDVVLLDYDSTSLQDHLTVDNATSFVPGDFADLSDPESAGVFNMGTVEENEEYVNEVFSFVENEEKRLKYADLVNKFFKDDEEE